MAPVVRALQSSGTIEPISCATAQHRHLLDQVLQFFALTPDHDLDLMKENQDLFDITSNCITRLKALLSSTKPDLVLVQGDTTTTFASALAAFYHKIPVGHVEAGLRTFQRYSPFPEEMNRKLVGSLADFHFAPTAESVAHLKIEGIASDKIFLTGNTSIDALLWARDREVTFPALDALHGEKPFILLTAHRRENFGAPIIDIFEAIRSFAGDFPGIHIIYPVHPNPNVKGKAKEILGTAPNISLIEPLGYAELVYLMKQCLFVLTDSGGIQEEAPSLGKPVLVLRETTERPEAVTAGSAILVGHDKKKILQMMTALTNRTSATYLSMSQVKNPFGDGTAAMQIRKILEQQL